ncbi:hypothetical protein [Chryseobacterium chendengshani]|uniref:hypothetical protein n=1 Tax=Chryseobacterium sp. LJ756 TaxID=2864113 RepID=UPI001C63C3A7|nr:hypothetical protein [Chryseobacterium sp. LJ756]MBW7674225.1 hypothetical protein [Chryseobacterium sp. LJ756]
MEYNYFYGAILIDRDYDLSKNFIIHEMIKKKYYYFHPNIFSLGESEYPYYYENVLVSFGRTAKYFVDNENELKVFLNEFEDILNNLDFETAQIIVQASYADFKLFWISKEKLINNLGDISKTTLQYFEENQIRYYETEKLYFGFGEVDLFTGYVFDKYDNEKLLDFDRKYPSFVYP